jgi:Na+-transporting methylmalonyl-CoA/oxaloacetate decarboxylase gamma subunit
MSYLSRVVSRSAGVLAAGALVLTIPVGIVVLALLSLLALAISCASYLFGLLAPVAPPQGNGYRSGKVIEGEYRVVDETVTSRRKE